MNSLMNVIEIKKNLLFIFVLSYIPLCLINNAFELINDRKLSDKKQPIHVKRFQHFNTWLATLPLIRPCHNIQCNANARRQVAK